MTPLSNDAVPGKVCHGPTHGPDGVWLALTEFSYDRRTHDKLRCSCHECNSYVAKRWYAANKVRHREAHDLIDAEDPRKAPARRFANRELRAGRLVRPDHCFHPGCDRTDLEMHHHLGYAEKNWGDVQWPCGRHHRAEKRGVTHRKHVIRPAVPPPVRRALQAA